MKNYIRAFQKHRAGAKKRGIEFILSFDEWLIFWKQSGKLNSRGRAGHQYCMARFGDKGAYELGNIKIIRQRENLSEGNTGRCFSLSHRQKISDSLKKHRVRRITRQKISEAMAGRILSQEHKEKISLALKAYITPAVLRKMRWRSRGKNNSRYGTTLSAATKMKISKARKARFAQERAVLTP